MTIAIITRDFIAADSRLTVGMTSAPVTVAKIFKRKGGGIFVTAGDCRRTYHFEKAAQQGLEPQPLEMLEGEDFDGVVLMPDRSIVLYDSDFSPCAIAEDWVTIGAPVQVVRSWMLNPPAGTPPARTPIVAIQRAIEVDNGCGYPISVAYLDGRAELISESGEVTHVTQRKTKRKH